MLRLELSLVITALRRSVLALVSISSQKPSSSAGGSFKRTTVARGRMGEQLSGLGSILNNQSSRDSYRCCPSKMPGATPVKRTSTVAMVVEVRSKEGMKVDEGEHRRTGNRNLFINIKNSPPPLPPFLHSVEIGSKCDTNHFFTAGFKSMHRGKGIYFHPPILFFR